MGGFQARNMHCLLRKSTSFIVIIYFIIIIHLMPLYLLLIIFTVYLNFSKIEYFAKEGPNISC